MIIRKHRRLSISGRVLVKVGDCVSPATKIATAEVPGYPVPIKAASKLGIEAHQLPQYMVKRIGEQVSHGEAIAKRKTFLGLSEEIVTSPIDGTLEDIALNTGVVTVVSLPVTVSLNGFIAGKVVEVLENEGAVIESPATVLEGVFGVGSEKFGVLKVVVANPDEVITAPLITADLKDSIIVGGSSITSDAIKKAIRLGVAGIICGSIEDEVLAEYVGYDIGIPITGREEIPITIIITEGFGSIAMANKTFDLLKKMQGNLTSITGKTHIRAEITRPEIIITMPADDATEAVVVPKLVELTPGTTVRIMSEPYFGRIGSVVAQREGLEEMQSEIRVAVVEIVLENNTTAVVPVSNVEICAN